MTCLVVLNQIQSHSISLETALITSNYASEMKGTSANLKEGDVIRVIDALYGLMLPSGNDAAIALAEFIGKYLPCGKDIEENRVEEENFESRGPVWSFVCGKQRLNDYI